MSKKKKNKDKINLSKKELREALDYAMKQTVQAEQALREYKKARSTWCMTRDKFTETYTSGLEQYLQSAHPGDGRQGHPEDMATAALVYSEIFMIIMENLDWYDITGSERPMFGF